MAVLKKLPYRPMVIVWLLFLLIFPFWFRWKYQLANQAMNAFDDGEQIELKGILYKKEPLDRGYRLYFKHLYISDTSFPGRAVVISETAEFPLQSKLHIFGQVSSFSVAENEGSFDEQKYMLGQGIFLKMNISKVESCVTLKTTLFFESLYLFRESIRIVFENIFPGEEMGLMSAMVLGDKTLMDAEVKELFSAAGISHLLAVSGLHVSIVGMGLYRFFRRRGFLFFTSGILSLCVVFCYGVMTGFSVSTMRAVFMFFVLVLAQIRGEKYDMLSAWCLAFMLVLLWEPLSILNMGFVFSFGAVLGIVLVANPLVGQYESLCKKRFEKTLRFRQGKNYRKSLNEEVTSSVLFALGMQLFTLPVVARIYYQFPVYVVGLNLLFIPLLVIVVGFGLVGGVVGAVAMGMTSMGVSMVAFFAKGLWRLSGKLLFPCHIILYIYEAVSDFSLKLPGSQIVTGYPSVVKLVFYYAVLILCIWLKLKSPKNCKRNLKVFFLKYNVVTLMLAVILSIHLPKSFEMDMLSVGQGDGIFIRSRENVIFMIDGGSSSKNQIGKYILTPFLHYQGVKRIDYWMLSHMDSDHISGCMELLQEGFPVSCLIFPETVLVEEDETAKEHYETLLNLCEKNHTTVRYAKRGDTFGTKTLGFTVLAPDNHSGFSGTNENSMVIKMSYEEFDVVFTGDIGSEQEEWLLSQFREDDTFKDIEILKSAHHGSKNSNSSKWLSELHPDLCLISAGKNNSYGHPSRETLERMNELDLEYLCTIDCGQISVKFEKGQIKYKKMY